jgi:hypothetical protein
MLPKDAFMAMNNSTEYAQTLVNSEFATLQAEVKNILQTLQSNFESVQGQSYNDFVNGTSGSQNTLAGTNTQNTQQQHAYQCQYIYSVISRIGGNCMKITKSAMLASLMAFMACTSTSPVAAQTIPPEVATLAQYTAQGVVKSVAGDLTSWGMASLGFPGTNSSAELASLLKEVVEETGRQVENLSYFTAPLVTP